MLLGLPVLLASCSAGSIPSDNALFIILYTFCLLVDNDSAILSGFSPCEYINRIFDLSTIRASLILDADSFFSIASSSPVSFSSPMDFLNTMVTYYEGVLIIVTLLWKRYNIKALVTPIDVFGSNAAKYNEKLPMSYKFSYELNKVDLKKLWPVFTKIDKVEIYPSFNSGFIAVRPEVGIFRKWREMFEVSVRVGYFGIINPFSAQFFFTDQVFLSSVIVSMLGRSDIEILDDGYNFPLNFAQRIYNVKGKIDLNEITFLHYHHSFYDMNWTEFFNADDTNISWLIHKLPLFKDIHTAVYRHKVEYIKQYILYCYWKIKLILVPLNKTDNPREKSSVVEK